MDVLDSKLEDLLVAKKAQFCLGNIQGTIKGKFCQATLAHCKLDLFQADFPIGINIFLQLGS
jgi:hypothetical protein